ncbi:hypothetical protein [Stappia indica]|uniref:hypothetical protein n=1 Tax=Stappia indica TaxID=538381 RepID=UPI001CD6D8F5|nr:hypothetical protein [Stappia indica]MCA1298009.1 hypothetical protein [Stappia indica]
MSAHASTNNATRLIIIDRVGGMDTIRETDHSDTLAKFSADLVDGDFCDVQKVFRLDLVTGQTVDITKDAIEAAVVHGLYNCWTRLRNVPAWFRDNGHVTEDDFEDAGDPNAEHRLTAAALGVGRAA